MQHVKGRWLTIFAWFLLSLDILILASYYYFTAIEPSTAQLQKWGLTPLILAMALIHALYVLFIFPFVRKKSEWLGSFISEASFVILIAAIIETSHYNNLAIRLAYAGFVFLTALTGPFVPVATVVATWVFFLYTYLGVLSGTESGISFRFEIMMNLLVTAGGVLGLLTFKRFYIKKRAAETVALAKLLEEEQIKSGAILESITDGVLVVNIKGVVRIANLAVADLLGWKQNEAIDLDYHSILKPVIEEGEQSATDAVSECLKTGKPVQLLGKFETAHKRQLYIDVAASPIHQTIEPHGGGQGEKKLTGVIAVLRDVDEQRRQEQQRSDFISTASHEMRTPVASIQGFLELALNPKVSKIDDKAKNYLQKAHYATIQLGELFQDLLTVSKSDDGRLTVKPRILDIHEVLKEVQEQEMAKAKSKGLSLNYQQPKRLGKITHMTPLLYVEADPDRLKEVLLNLIDNAIKYTEQGMITLGAETKANSVVIRVADTGNGIAEEDMPHLFQKFYRIDNSTTREIGGTGLGLYICKQIIETMGGRIWVESTLGAGSTFCVELPRVSPETLQKRLATQP